jgi:hypothetical protein
MYANTVLAPRFLSLCLPLALLPYQLLLQFVVIHFFFFLFFYLSYFATSRPFLPHFVSFFRVTMNASLNKLIPFSHCNDAMNWFVIKLLTVFDFKKVGVISVVNGHSYWFWLMIQKLLSIVIKPRLIR